MNKIQYSFLTLLLVLFLSIVLTSHRLKADLSTSELTEIVPQTLLNNVNITSSLNNSGIAKSQPLAVDSNEPGQTCFVIDFEGIGELSPVPEFDGVTSIGWLGVIDSDAGGHGNIAFEPSPSTVAFWLEGDPSSRSIDFDVPVSFVAFQYASYVNVQLQAFDATGNSLGAVTGPKNWNTGAGGDPNGAYNKWDPITIDVGANLIHSIKVIGNQNNTAIDDLKICRTISINSVEFTQAIQEFQTLDEFKDGITVDKTPPVQLIANKPLALRVYMEQVSTSTEVTLKLSGVADQEKTVTLQPNCSPKQSREQLNSCQSIDFYFTPPVGDWTATVRSFDQNGNEIESHDFALVSVETQPLRLVPVTICWQNTLPPFTNLCQDGNRLSEYTGLLLKTAPTPSVQIIPEQYRVTEGSSGLFPKSWWLNVLFDINVLKVLHGPSDSQYHGMVPHDAPGLASGIMGIGSFDGAASRVLLPSVPDYMNLTERAVTHETGHTLGASHTGTGVPADKCSDSPNQFPDWPYPNNYIQEVGFDVSEGKAIGAESAFDWMGYCFSHKMWISPHTFREAIGELEVAQSAASIDKIEAFQEFWLISGIISDTLVLEPLLKLETEGTIETSDGDYSITILDFEDNVLFTRLFNPQAIGIEPESGDEEAVSIFSELVPVQSGATQIVIKDATTNEIGSLVFSGLSPNVNIISPSGGETLNGIQTVDWTINDSDSTQWTSWVQYSPDNGSTWQTIATGLTETSLVVNFSEISGSDGNALIRVLVSDGINTGLAESGEFTVPTKPPSVEILFPQNDAVFGLGELVYLQSYAYDYEDGLLTNLIWTSSIDGQLGNSVQLPLTELSHGTHNISLTVEDSDGNVVSKSITVYIDGDTPELEFVVTSNGIPASCVDVTINAFDPIGGTGLKSVDYSLDGAVSWTSIDDQSLPFDFKVDRVGFIHLVVRAIDEAGNQAVADERFFIDEPCANTMQLFLPSIFK